MVDRTKDNDIVGVWWAIESKEQIVWGSIDGCNVADLQSSSSCKLELKEFWLGNHRLIYPKKKKFELSDELVLNKLVNRLLSVCLSLDNQKVRGDVTTVQRRDRD